MKEIALKYARRGWKIFPITPGQKVPPLVEWSKEASNDLLTVGNWWDRWPQANIGIDCGKSELTVLDIDCSKGKDGYSSLGILEIEYEDLPKTYSVETPTGGRHLYFCGITASSVEKIGEGLDTRSSGGYVLAAGSTIEGRKYAFLVERPVLPVPDWLKTLIGKPREKSQRTAPTIDLDSKEAMAWGKHFLEKDADPAIEGSGGDAKTYETACILRDRGLSQTASTELMLDYYNPRCIPPWLPEDLERKVSNAYEYAVTGSEGFVSPSAEFPDDLEEVGPVGPPKETKRKKKPTLEERNPDSLTPKEQEKLSERGSFFSKWVFIVKPRVFIRKSDNLELEIKSFDAKFGYMAESGKLSDAIFKSKQLMRKPMQICYRPRQKEFCGELYNMWKDTLVKPKPGGAPWFEDHIDYLVSGRQIERELVLDWFAWAVQHPEKKINFALLIQGEEGTGKSWIGNLMRAVLGIGNYVEPSNEELHGQFNSWAKSGQLCVIHELMATGRRDMANKLKPLITESRIRVEEKFKTPYLVDNYMNFLLFTNYLDAIPLEKGDRRYFVIAAPTKHKPISYYKKLWDDLRDDPDFAARTAGYLLDRDVTNFKYNGTAPLTTDKQVMINHAMSDVEQHLAARFVDEGAPFSNDLVTMDDIIAALPPYLRHGGRMGNTIGRFLRRDLKAVCLGQHRIANQKQKITLWAVRNQELIEQLPPAQRVARYLEQTGSKPLTREDEELFN